MDRATEEKIQQMKDDGQLIGCMSCLGTFDDGAHEYDPSIDIFYCPALDE